MGVLTCFAIAGFSSRYFSWRAGLWGAAIFGFLPVVVIFGPAGYIDVGLCFFQVMAFWAIFNWLENEDPRTLVVAALMTGIAMGIKHQGMATIVVGVAIVVSHRILKKDYDGAVRDTAMFGLIALAVVSPWYLRSYILAGIRYGHWQTSGSRDCRSNRRQ